MKQFGKILVIMVLIAMAASAYAAFPEVTQFTYNPSPAVPGSTITILVQLENKDTATQKGVTLNVENAYPFTVKTTDTNPNPDNIGDIEGYGKALAQFTIYVDPSAENKTYSLPITITTAGDPNGKKTEFPIIISGKEPFLKVLSVSNQTLLPGDDKDITLTVQNVGTSPAYDVTVELQEDRTVTQTGVVVERDITPLGAATAYLPSINPGEQKNAVLKVSANNTATIKDYTLPVTVSYRDASGARTSSISYIGLQVYGSAELDAELKTVTGNVANGQTADVTIEVFNKGLGKADFVLAQMSTANGTVNKPKQFIGSLNPNDVDTVESTISFNTPGDQTVDVTVQYQDADATMKTTTLHVPLKASTATDQGTNPIFIIIIIVVIAALVWNFFFRGKKKK